MKELLYLFLILVTFTSCNFTPSKVDQITSKCFVISDYNKTICLENEFDSLYPVIYIDKYKLEMNREKFSDLKMYTLMVVEISGENVILSNINYSIKVRFKNVNKKGGIQLKIQDTFYVIVKRIYLSDSRIVVQSNGTKEELPNRKSNNRSSINTETDYEEVNVDDIGGDNYDSVDDPDKPH